MSVVFVPGVSRRLYAVEGLITDIRPIGESSRALWELDLRASQATQLIFTHDLWINSFAAAWFDTVTGKRNVIYEGSALTEYVVDDATSNSHPSNPT